MPVRLLVKSQAQTGDKSPKEHVLSDDQIVLGRDPSCTVVLNEQMVSRNHVRITRDGALYFVEDMGSSFGTRINTATLPKGEKRLLRNGDVIAVGPFDVTFDRIADVAQGGDHQTSYLAKKVVQDALKGLASGQGPYLRVMNGPLEGTRYELQEAQELVVGREEGVDILLENDDLASRKHARIRRDWEGTHIEDLGSRNGVKHNKKKIRSPVTLHDRDEVEIGSTRFLYLDPAEVRETPIVPEAKPPPPVPMDDDEEEGTDIGKAPPLEDAEEPSEEAPSVAVNEGALESSESEDESASGSEAASEEPPPPAPEPEPEPEAPPVAAAGIKGKLAGKVPKLPEGVDAKSLVPLLIFGGIGVGALVILAILFFAI